VFSENEATAAAAFTVQHLLGKSLNSHLVVFRRLHEAKIVEVPEKNILVVTLCVHFARLPMRYAWARTFFLFHTAKLEGAGQNPSPAEARHVTLSSPPWILRG
jgi:hypothetical protein